MCLCVCLRVGSTTISSGTRANTRALRTSASPRIRCGRRTSCSTTGKTCTHTHTHTPHTHTLSLNQIVSLPLLSFLSADDDFDSTFKTNVLVNSSGYAEYLPPGECLLLLLLSPQPLSSSASLLLILSPPHPLSSSSSLLLILSSHHIPSLFSLWNLILLSLSPPV